MSSAAAANSEEPPLKKPSTEPISIHSLPDDLLLSCLACVSRLYYPALSLVSKRFRSLLAPLKINQARSFLGRTEGCLFVCLQFPDEPNLRWFTLSWKPGNKEKEKEKEKKKKKKEKSSGNILVPIYFLNSPRKDSAFVAVGPNLYAIENVKGKILLSSVDGAAFDLKEMRGESIGFNMPWSFFHDCMVEDITLSYKTFKGEFDWEGVWRKLRGFKIPKFVGYSSVRFVACGGKMMALWEKYVHASEHDEIWCAVVALERRSDVELWGKVESLDAVLRVPEGYNFGYAFDATF
ncbi:unnamed protein product [Microthlaspi erraticum]|uniref:F-box domain-containing protein n=1 Tax=Microthlaspi erraticum TaxID=1685480 RepID=A0A6D2HH40_9BRAS|nr:unnamed protein product [Microthlaspi erraticum]